MNKILAVVGPTATGKTAFALKLASQVLESTNTYTGVDLISVDSRQVYKGLEILTGADIPEDFRLIAYQQGSSEPLTFPYYENRYADITLHGISIISVEQDWSVTHFKDFATNIILDSFKNKRLPILVGGTGLYHEHLRNNDISLYTPPNVDVRRKAEEMNAAQLSEWLFAVDPEALMQMNDSDIDNPRRLVRAIEKALQTKQYFVNDPLIEQTGKVEKKEQENLLTQSEIITFGMQVSLEQIQEKIADRVRERFKQGALAEVKKIRKLCKLNIAPSCSTLGVSDLLKFISHQISEEKCLENWGLHELQYAKRQLTWFKKQEGIIWLDELQKKQYTLFK